MKIHRKLVVCLFAFAMMLSACSTTSTAQITDNGDAVLKNTNFDSLESRTKKKWPQWSKLCIQLTPMQSKKILII